MQKILKNGTKVLKKIQLNNKILKIMETFYQVLYKGNASNRIYLDEFDDYKNYREHLERIRKSKFYVILETNMYYVQ